MNYYSQIHWVDEYVANISGYIYVRPYDRLLIKIPNEAYKLNEQGICLLQQLLGGKRVRDIIDMYCDREAVANDIHNFFCDLRAVLKGCFRDGQKRRAIEEIPFGLGFNQLPVLSEIALTYRCNLSCKFCYASCGCSRGSAVSEMTTAEVQKVLNIIKHEAEVPSVSFTGGEPTLREDLVELVAYAKSLSFWTNLITNGTLITRAKALHFKLAGLDSAQVSLEAGSAPVHDAIVGSSGAFQATLAGLKHLHEAGIRVHTNTTIQAQNKDHLLGVVDMVKSFGLNKFSMNMLMPEGSAVANITSVFISYSEISEYILRVDRYAREAGLEFMWYSPTPLCIFNPIVHGLGNKGCAACDGLLSINPAGDILPCSSFPKPMGNILAMKGSFKQAWKGKEFVYFQRKRFAHKLCQGCEYFAVCNGGCPLYWDKVGYEEILSPRSLKEVLA